MADYAADDVSFIANRMKEIERDSKPCQNDNLSTAIGRDLEFLAAECGLFRQAGEGDYTLTNRIREYKQKHGFVVLVYDTLEPMLTARSLGKCPQISKIARCPMAPPLASVGEAGKRGL